MPRVVVTGSEGFVGTALSAMLTSAGHEVVPVARNLVVPGNCHLSYSLLDAVMQDADAVIHLAARAHVIVENHSDPLAEFRRVNVAGSLSIAEAAARAGVSRFVFVSSIGVLGNTSGGRIFAETDVPAPQEPYAISKLEAEQALQVLSRKSALELVIVRPPLVYGPQVKGNFSRLLRLVASGIPLPFGAVQNQRSYIGLYNLCDFLLSCTFNPSAKGRLFHVADGEDVSTPELLEMLAAAMGRRSKVFCCPLPLLSVAAGMLGKRAELNRLTTNLRVDSSLARALLGWHPIKDLQTGIVDMARWFITEHCS